MDDELQQIWMFEKAAMTRTPARCVVQDCERDQQDA